jgi:hypothetical protein
MSASQANTDPTEKVAPVFPPGIEGARQYAAFPFRDCANHAFDPDFGFADHVTDADKAQYVIEHNTYADEVEAGLHDHNFTVWQRMNYFKTGQCVAFLP